MAEERITTAEAKRLTTVGLPLTPQCARGALLDLIDARVEIARLTRDLDMHREGMFSIEKHARAVQEAFWESFIARCDGWLSPITAWMGGHVLAGGKITTRRDLLAALRAAGISDTQAVAMADNTDGDP